MTAIRFAGKRKLQVTTPTVTMVARLCLLFAICLGGSSNVLRAQDDVDQLIQQLSNKHDEATRIAASEQLIDLQDGRELAAREGLERGLDDSSAKVRMKFAVALALILARHEQPCPQRLVEMLFDPDKDVRYNVELVLATFDRFDKECLPQVLEFYDKADVETRVNNLPLLAKAGGTDEGVLSILKEAVESDHAGARVNATAAMWLATKDLRVYVPMLIDRVNEAREFAASDQQHPVDKNDHTGAHLALGLLGSAYVFQVHLAERETMFLEVLDELANSKSVQTRRGLAYWMAIAIAQPIENIKSEDQTEVDVRHEMPSADLSKLRPLLGRLSGDEDEFVKKQAVTAIGYLERRRQDNIRE